MQDPISQNVEGVRQLIASRLNKIGGGASADPEGPSPDRVDEFTLNLSDEELLRLSRRWENKYASYESKLNVRQNANRTYYLGQQKGTSADSTDGLPIASNLLFEAEETFLPAALSRNPEPVVWSDNTTEGNEVSNSVKTMLQYHADVLALRQKMKLMTRHWSLYFIGVIKHGWDNEINDIKSDVRNPKNFIFDPDASVDAYGDMEGYVGERIKCTAQELIDLFPAQKDFVITQVDGQLGTEVTYTEWWNDDYCFYTYGEHVLDKHKNPNFNYAKTVTEKDEDGVEVETEEGGRNHFAKPKKPYTFLTVFTLGEQPHDVTNLVEQNIPNQNLITRRTIQLDYNLSRANNSDVFSENNFNQETAKQAATGMAKGNPLLVPAGGPISDAIHRLQAPSIGAEFFQDLENNKQNLRSIFGTEGISSQTPDEDTTARGMILSQQFDNTRIGGGIGDALEQVADNIFNWWVQLYYVYYDEEHFAAVMGQMKAVEYIEFSQLDLNKRLVVSVSPNSMKPKDEITKMNQALALWEKGALDPKTLLTILDFPDPQKTAENTVLWLVDKTAYLQLNFPELSEKLLSLQPAAPDPMVGGMAPEEVTEPMQSIEEPVASSSLSQVPLESQALPA